MIPANFPGLQNLDGHVVAVQVSNLAQNERYGVPIYVVRVGVLAGQVDTPRFVFGHALKVAYSAVLNHTHQAPDVEDMVQLQLQHPELRSNGGFFYSENLVIQSTGKSFVY